MILLGIDVGGSSIKAAPVNVETGALAAAPVSVATPQPAQPSSVAASLRRLADGFGTSGPVGVALPTVVKQGLTCTAANIDSGWIGLNAGELMNRALGRQVALLNDADAAGVAEMRLGAGRGHLGTALLLTFGTGIGSALFVDDRLVPNVELGHLLLNGHQAEHLASGRARSAENLSWMQWTARVNELLDYIHSLLWPDLFIISGGVTEHYEAFGPLLKSRARIVPARFRAHAGIVGAALTAAQLR